jgi:hypothetical protein
MIGRTDRCRSVLVVDDPTISIRLAPTDEEAAAIVAAVEALWPKPSIAVPVERRGTLAWRFSGRWWQRDRMAHPERPWR